MPLPILLWGAAAALAATGVFKGVGAVQDMNDAKETGENAERRYSRKKRDLESLREETNQKFEELGKLKVHIFSNQIKHIVDILKKTKDVGSNIKDFEGKFSIEELKQMETMVLNSLKIENGLLSGATGGALAGLGAYGSVGILASASTGTAISTLSGVAATNATLAWLGGGSLAAGGFGMAGGMIALGGIVAGPALAIGGFMLAGKAEEALTEARRYRASVDEAIAQMDLVEVGLKGLQDNISEMRYAITEMTNRFEQVKVDDNKNHDEFMQMLAIGKTLKNLLDVKIMTTEGSPVPNIKQTCSGYLAH